MNTELIERIKNVLDWHQRSVEPEQGDYGFTRMKQRGIDEDKRQVHFLCSTGTIDRYGEIVEPEAYRASLDSFMDNPVFAAGHQHIGLSGEPTVIGHWEKVWISKDGLEGIAQFDDEDELAKRYWNNYRKGHMRAVSVGFIANAWEMRDVEIEKERQRVRVFTSVDLIEISAVMVGANPDALVRRSAAQAGAGSEAKTVDLIVQALGKFFHTGPGGPMAMLAQDVAELVVRGGQGEEDVYGDILEPDVPEPVSVSQGKDNELKAALLDALGKAG